MTILRTPRQEAQEAYVAAGLALGAIREAQVRLAGCYVATADDLRAVELAHLAVLRVRVRALTRLHDAERIEDAR